MGIRPQRTPKNSYNPNYPQRDRRDPFEVYRLEQGQYLRQVGETIWMPELQLGIGCGRRGYENWEREWLYWFDECGQRYATPEEVTQPERQQREAALQEVERERQQREAAQRETERLARYLKQLGINPETLN